MLTYFAPRVAEKLEIKVALEPSRRPSAAMRLWRYKGVPPAPKSANIPPSSAAIQSGAAMTRSLKAIWCRASAPRRWVTIIGVVLPVIAVVSRRPGSSASIVPPTIMIPATDGACGRRSATPADVRRGRKSSPRPPRRRRTRRRMADRIPTVRVIRVYIARAAGFASLAAAPPTPAPKVESAAAPVMAPPPMPSVSQPTPALPPWAAGPTVTIAPSATPPFPIRRRSRSRNPTGRADPRADPDTAAQAASYGRARCDRCRAIAAAAPGRDDGEAGFRRAVLRASHGPIIHDAQVQPRRNGRSAIPWRRRD